MSLSLQTGAARRRFTLGLSGLGLAAAIVVLALLILAVIGPYIAPYAPTDMVSDTIFGPMTRRDPLGTDFLGRDMFSRILLGTRYTIGLALPATLFATLSGATLGMLAAVRGGSFDFTASRTMDVLISFPSIIFSLIVIAVAGSSIPVLILTAGVIYTPGCFRIVRSVAVGINATDYVRAARARGEGSSAIMLGEILPNIVGPVLTDFGLRFVFIVLLMSSLSFLGLGIQPPAADWGSLVRENVDGLSAGAPAVLVPAVAIAVLTVAVNLLIDNLPGRRTRIAIR